MTLVDICAKKYDSYWRQRALEAYGEKGEDILHECYFRLYRYDQEKLKQMTDSGVIKWVMVRMLQQVFISNIRSDSKIDFVEELPISETQEEDELFKCIDTMIKEVHIRQKLKNVPFMEREIFKLHFFEGYKSTEIEAETEINWRTCEKAIQKVKLYLQSELSNGG